MWKYNVMEKWPDMHTLTHWGRVTHICVSNLTITGSDNSLSPGRRQAIIWTNAEILLIGPLGTDFSEMWIAIEAFSFKNKHLQMSFGKCRPFCLGLNVFKSNLRGFQDAIEVHNGSDRCTLRNLAFDIPIELIKIEDLEVNEGDS